MAALCFLLRLAFGISAKVAARITYKLRAICVRAGRQCRCLADLLRSWARCVCFLADVHLFVANVASKGGAAANAAGELNDAMGGKSCAARE